MGTLWGSFFAPDNAVVLNHARVFIALKNYYGVLYAKILKIYTFSIIDISHKSDQ